MASALTGYHPADVNISGWMTAFDHFRATPQTLYDGSFAEIELRKGTELPDRFEQDLDEKTFGAALDTALDPLACDVLAEAAFAFDAALDRLALSDRDRDIIARNAAIYGSVGPSLR